MTTEVSEEEASEVLGNNVDVTSVILVDVGWVAETVVAEDAAEVAAGVANGAVMLVEAVDVCSPSVGFAASGTIVLFGRVTSVVSTAAEV